MERNSWGWHGKATFVPDEDLIMRCWKCNRLFDAGFTDEMQCPNCNFKFSKAEARDMFIEAKAVKVNQNGWNREILIELYGKPPSTVGEKKSRPIDAVAREVSARFSKRQKVAKDELISAVRRLSAVSRL